MPEKPCMQVAYNGTARPDGRGSGVVKGRRCVQFLTMHGSGCLLRPMVWGGSGKHDKGTQNKAAGKAFCAKIAGTCKLYDVAECRSCGMGAHYSPPFGFLVPDAFAMNWNSPSVSSRSLRSGAGVKRTSVVSPSVVTSLALFCERPLTFSLNVPRPSMSTVCPSSSASQMNCEKSVRMPRTGHPLLHSP